MIFKSRGNFFFKKQSHRWISSINFKHTVQKNGCFIFLKNKIFTRKKKEIDMIITNCIKKIFFFILKVFYQSPLVAAETASAKVKWKKFFCFFELISLEIIVLLLESSISVSSLLSFFSFLSVSC